MKKSGIFTDLLETKIPTKHQKPQALTYPIHLTKPTGCQVEKATI